MHRQVSVVYEGFDSDTPKNVQLSAKYMRSFAYTVVKDRLPVILTRVINELATNKGKILKQYGQGSEEDLKSVIGKISKLKNEVVTNKSLIKLCSNGEDADDWNNILDSYIKLGDKFSCWYYSPWLLIECYMYRRLWEIFETSETLQDYDPFANQKESSFDVSLTDAKIVSQITLKAVTEIGSSNQNLKEKFIEFLKLSLWSNKCDLSLSNGAQLSEEDLTLSNINAFDSFLLCDNSEEVYELLKHRNNSIIDFVNDNSPYEVFCDFCFCDFLCTSSLASKIRFHVKRIPWYVSDTMKKDITWLLDKMEQVGMGKLSDRWKKYFQDGIWSASAEKYWTLPFDYNDMKERDSALYNLLSGSDLVIFKGDLNYRKLLGDINWDFCEKFDVAIREFKPTNILSLRTVKADLICGLTQEKCRGLPEGMMWMETGEYATIQFYHRG